MYLILEQAMLNNPQIIQLEISHTVKLDFSPKSIIHCPLLEILCQKVEHKIAAKKSHLGYEVNWCTVCSHKCKKSNKDTFFTGGIILWELFI